MAWRLRSKLTTGLSRRKIGAKALHRSTKNVLHASKENNDRVGSAVVLSDLQPPRLEIFLPALALLVLKRRRHRIVPAMGKKRPHPRARADSRRKFAGDEECG